MKSKLWLVLILAVPVMIFAGCGDDDNDGGTGAEVDVIVGQWLSEGANVAPGLVATLKTKSITATFNENQTYTVVATDSSDVSVTYQGTYVTEANDGTTIRSITLNQTVPTSLTSQGIYEVSGSLLTYEVIQTDPALTGFTAPTPEGGFGSTAFQGTPLGATWVQKFELQ